MVFSSVIFLFAFLPITLLLYHLICLPIWRGSSATLWQHLANLFLLGVSLVFYFWGEKFLVWVFVSTVVIDYVCALLISGALTRREADCLTPGGVRTRFQKGVLAASIFSNMALLGYFKYFNFGVDTFNTVAKRAGLNSLAWETAPRVLLPLGISFFVFHSMSYTIDVYRGSVKATRNLIDYAAYVLMFPQLVAGPIVRYSLVAQQFLERRLDIETFASGAARFICGLTKKVLVANTVSTLADQIFALPSADVHFQLAWLGMIAYTLQIYFDFSGYSDMAIGLGRMLGFELPINFNYPYTASSVREFWQRWHISLSTWFRDYLYFPLGGSRTSMPRAYANLVTVFFLCGLWHGAKWTFVAWGFYHGLFLVLERIGIERLLGNVKFLRHVYALTAILAGWVLFRADTFGQALGLLRSLAGLNRGANTYPIQWLVTPDIGLAMAGGVIFCMPVVPIIQRGMDHMVTRAEGSMRSTYLALFCGLRLTGAAVSMLLCASSLATGTHNPFIYFRF